MKKPILFPLACALIAFALSRVDAEEKPKGPIQLEKQELEAARADVAKLDTTLRAQLDALRYLLRPGFQDEYLAGRRARPSRLAPLEAAAQGPLSVPELCRLWALVESGHALTPEIERDLGRLVLGPLGRQDDLLAVPAIEVLTARAAVVNLKPAALERKLVDFALARHKHAEAMSGATGKDSRHVRGQVIAPVWFANHFWRAALCRAIADLGEGGPAPTFASHLEALLACKDSSRGWVSYAGMPGVQGADLDTNLFAIAALELAQGAPDKQLAPALKKRAAKALENRAALVQAAMTVAGSTALSAPRALLYASGRAFPTGETEASFRARLTAEILEQQTADGALPASDDLWQNVGLGGLMLADAARADSLSCFTALGLVGLQGGLFSAPALSGRPLADIGRWIFHLTLVHAAQAREVPNGFIDAVNLAIEDGCRWLASQQRADGGFPGAHEYYLGNHAMAGMALIHGGFSRDSKVVARLIEFLDKNKWGEGLAMQAGRQGLMLDNYSAGILLMLLQLYYMPEIRDTGGLTAKTPAELRKAREALRKKLKPEHERAAKFLCEFIKGALIRGGGYGYGYANSGWTGYKGDNSNSQYSMLGFKAAAVLGIDVDSGVFKQEAQRLVNDFWEDSNATPVAFEDLEEQQGDSRRSRTATKVQPGGWHYESSKSRASMLQYGAAGVCSLVICIDELRAQGKLERGLEDKCEKTICAAVGWMAQNYYSPEALARNQALSYFGDGWGFFYDIYSVERACVLSRIHKLSGEVDWYTDVAKCLIELQKPDGSWGGARQYAGGRASQPNTINQCMAILFLKRAGLPVITEHRKRDRSPDPLPSEPKPDPEKPKGPVTGK